MLRRDEIKTVFEENYSSLCRFAGSIVGNGGQAQEIAQESFLRLCQTEAKSIPFSEIRFWLFRVARNLAVNELNKLKTQTRLMDKAAFFLRRHRANPEELLMENDDQIMVRRLLNKLPEHQRSALILREQEDMRYRDIAIVLDISEGKVKSDIFRGRKRLRKLWFDFIGDKSGEKKGF